MKYVNKPNNPVLLFFGAVLLGLVIAFIFMYLNLYIFSKGHITSASLAMATSQRNQMIVLQLIQMIGFFILPPVFFALFSKNDFATLFNFNHHSSAQKYLFGILFAVSLFPILISLQDVIMQMPFPESLKLQAEAEKMASEKILSMLLDSPSFGNFVLMLIIVGLGAGLTEELFFRGLMMPLIADVFYNKWAGIILSGLIFSAFHLNIYDFLPITIVGIALGCIYWQTQDLKLNIFIHAFFNSIQVFINYLYQIKWLNFDIDEIKSFPWYIVIPCIIVCVISFKFLTKKNQTI